MGEKWIYEDSYPTGGIGWITESVEYWKGSYVLKGIINKMMFITDGHPVALEDILGWMIFSGEDIADIRCFLARLVTGDNLAV
jgi:hypothetical protein